MYSPPNSATMTPTNMKLRPNVASTLSTSSLPWLWRGAPAADQYRVDPQFARPGARHNEHQREQRAELRGCVKPEGAERAGDKHPAVGEIRGARDAVLELQAHRHQGVGAAEQQADDDNVHVG